MKKATEKKKRPGVGAPKRFHRKVTQEATIR
jgi:hypothetical protein